MILLPYRTERTLTRTPFITWALVAANLAIFIWTVSMAQVRRDMLFFDYGFVPEEWRRWDNFITCMFLHGGWLHLLGNMLFLYIFGQLVEDRLGPAGFALLYLASGLLASLAHLLTTPEFLWDVPCIGASGAISGILGAAAVIHAKEKVRVFYLWILSIRPLFGSLDLPVVVLLGFWFLAQFVYAMSFSEMSTSVEVAYWAHVGGFAFGALVGLCTCMGQSVRETWADWKRERCRRDLLNAVKRRDWGVAEGLLAECRSGEKMPEEWDLLHARIALERGDTRTAIAEAEAVIHRQLARRQRKGLLNAYALTTATGELPLLDGHESLVLVRALNASGRTAEAMGWLSRALRREPDGPAAAGLIFEWAETEAQAGHHPRARALFKHLAGRCADTQLAQAAQWRAKELEDAGSH